MWKGNRCLVSGKWASKGELGAKKGKDKGKAALHDTDLLPPPHWAFPGLSSTTICVEPAVVCD